MDVTPLIGPDRQVIQAYAAGNFRISGRVFGGPVIVTPDVAFGWNTPGVFSGLKLDDFVQLLPLAAALDVVLLGCGTVMAFLPPDLKKSLKEAGLRIETMDTGAACRTYNVLMAEGRRVAAALLPV